MTSQQLLAIVAGAGQTPPYVCLTYTSEDAYLETVGLLADLADALNLDVVTGRVDIGFTPNPEGAYEATWVYSGGTDPRHRILTLGGPAGVFSGGRMVGTPIERLAAVSAVAPEYEGAEATLVDRYTVTDAGRAALEAA